MLVNQMNQDKFANIENRSYVSQQTRNSGKWIEKSAFEISVNAFLFLVGLFEQAE